MNRTHLAIIIVTAIFSANCSTTANAKDVDTSIAIVLQSIENKSDDERTNVSLRLSEFITEKAAKIFASPLSQAQQHGLAVLTSSDSKLRVLSWDTETGGSAHNCLEVALFSSGGKISSQQLHPEPSADLEPSPSCDALDLVKTKDDLTVYLVRNSTRISNLGSNESIESYVIKDHKLEKYPFFKTRTQFLNSINYEIDFPDPKGKIELSDNGHTLDIPIVMSDGKATGRYLTYVFDGTKFVYSGTSK